MQIETTTWLLFGGFVLAMIVIDLFVFGRKGQEVTMRQAAAWSVVWLAIGLGFAAVVWHLEGATRATEYVTGYLIEKSLSVDNIFVFSMIFTFFAVPAAVRPRVLLWGILGALVLRAVMIFAGAAALDRYHAVIYVFGALLVLTGIKLTRDKAHSVNPERNPVLRLVNRLLPSVPEYHGNRVFTRHNGVLMATPLVGVFAVVASTDVIFAIDSIPAIFAVTREPFIVLTANVFALLGLRALYFLLDGLVHRFVYLKAGLAAILMFVGTKMLISDMYKVPVWASLAVVLSIVTVSVVASMIVTRGTGGGDGDGHGGGGPGSVGDLVPQPSPTGLPVAPAATVAAGVGGAPGHDG